MFFFFEQVVYYVWRAACPSSASSLHGSAHNSAVESDNLGVHKRSILELVQPTPYSVACRERTPRDGDDDYELIVVVTSSGYAGQLKGLVSCRGRANVSPVHRPS